MSQVISKIIKHKSSKSTSSHQAQSWTIGDSRPSRSQCITNSRILRQTTGTFTGLIKLPKLSRHTLVTIAPMFALVFMFSLNLLFSNADTHAVTGSTINLSISDATLDVDIASIKANGTFAKSNNSTIKVSTDNISGYTLSIAANGTTDATTGYAPLINTKDTSKKINSISNKITQDDFKDPIAGATYNGTWGYLPSKYCTGSTSDTCSSNTSENPTFFPSPTTTAGNNVLDITEAANSTANEYTLAIGARIDSTVALGSYNNTFVIYATANAVPYSITYDDNVVSNMPTDTTGTTENSTIALSPNIPTRDGYKFVGWCTKSGATITSEAECTAAGGTFYAAGASVPIGGTGGNEYHLYAIWKETVVIYMQNITSAALATLMPNVDDSVTLTDSRDEQEYSVTRLADNKYWMTTNLNLAGGTEIESTKSNVPEGYTLSAASGFQDGNKLPESVDPVNGSELFNSNNTTCASGLPCHSYYAWNIATAGSGTNISNKNTNAEYSICPAGWRLPTTYDGTNEDADFRALIIAYGGSSTVSLYNAYSNPTGSMLYSLVGPGTAPNLSLGGYYAGKNNLLYGGEVGEYWSATAASATEAFGIIFRGSFFNAAIKLQRGSVNNPNLNSIRCIHD